MKKLILTILLIVVMLKTANAYCYGVKPIKPYTFCNGNWVLICTGESWTWMCSEGY